MRMILEPATDKSKAVLPGKILPKRVFHLLPTVAVAPGNERDYPA